MSLRLATLGSLNFLAGRTEPDLSVAVRQWSIATGAIAAIALALGLGGHLLGLDEPERLLIAPFGAAALLLGFGRDQGRLAPAAVLLGLVLSATVGVVLHAALPAQPGLAACLGFALATLLMQASRSLYPPGGAVAILAAGGVDFGFSPALFPLFPVAVGALVLLAVGHLAKRDQPDRPCPVVPTADAAQLRLLGLFNKVALAANEADSVDAAVTACLEAVCQHTEWPIAHAYHPDADGTLISTRQWYIAPHLAGGPIADFKRMSEETRFKPGTGMVGRVAAGGEPVVLPDVGKAQGFLRAQAAQQNGVRGCFAFPVTSGRRVVMVLEFFSPEQAVLDDTTLRLMSYVGGQIARVVERMESNQRLGALARALEVEVKGVAGTVCAAAGAVADAAGDLAEAAEQAGMRSDQAKRGADQITRAVAHVADAATAFERSSREIADWVGRTDRIASSANQSADATGKAVAELEGAIDHVDRVIDAISTIARSINMLALNATIEAKRAGAAGRGFEVVASEVRALAGQTATATEEVRRIVQQIKGVGRQTRDALDHIGTVIADMACTSQGIRTSLESQAAVTVTVTDGIQEAGRDSAVVAENVRHLDDSTQQNHVAAAQLLTAATDLTSQGQSLAASIDTFLGGVRRLMEA